MTHFKNCIWISCYFITMLKEMLANWIPLIRIIIICGIIPIIVCIWHVAIIVCIRVISIIVCSVVTIIIRIRIIPRPVRICLCRLLCISNCRFWCRFCNSNCKFWCRLCISNYRCWWRRCISRIRSSISTKTKLVVIRKIFSKSTTRSIIPIIISLTPVALKSLKI